MSRILIIKLGALGDFFMAQPAISAIRAHHCKDHLSLLTISSLRSLAAMSGMFDAIMEDPHDRWPLGHWRIARRLKQRGFERIYDLQGTTRTGWYFRFLWPGRPAWAGPVAGCTHPRPPRPPTAHRTAWYAAQLETLGIVISAQADPSWLRADLSGLDLPLRYALIAAGGSAHRPAKRWPVECYVTLATQISARGIVPVLLGTDIDAAVNRALAEQVPSAIDLTGRTSIPMLASLARGAVGAVGNDTGPMHVIAATGCPCVVLYSDASDPGFVSPLGPQVVCLQRSTLSTLPAELVLEIIYQRWRLGSLCAC